MDYLLEEAKKLAIDLRVWEDLAMTHASDMEFELHIREISCHTQIYTLEEYACWMRIATPDRCLFGNTPELHLIVHRYSLNVAVFEVEPYNPQEYILRQTIMVDPNNHENVIYLLIYENHDQ